MTSLKDGMKSSNLVALVNEKYASPNISTFPKFRPGDTINVFYTIKEGEKSRVQEYTGICIAMKAAGTMNGHFRVRKISANVGVERVFPFHSPNIAKIEIINRGNAGRAKLYYLRDRVGKSARVGTDYDRALE